jgi:transposase
MSYQLYPNDLTDREWEYIKPLIPAAKPGGRKRQTDMRLTLNAIFYLNRTGCQWRHLPREYPPWETVYGYFRAWRIAGVWERIHDRLRDLTREWEGRERQPTAAVLDSQSFKTTDRGGPERGYDAGKRIYGRKRHLLVDTLGLPLLVKVHSAGTQDRDGAQVVLEPLAKRFTKLRKIWADSIYNGGIAEWVRALRQRNRIDSKTQVNDTVFSYAYGKIQAIGIVKSECQNADRPNDFGKRGEQWDTDGWLVPIAWSRLGTPINPKSHLSEIRPLLPEKHSPIQPNGNGNQKCYLAEISDALGSTLLRIANSQNGAAIAIPEDLGAILNSPMTNQFLMYWKEDQIAEII